MVATPTQIVWSDDDRNRRTVLELVAADRPGLLCELGKIFTSEKVQLLAARIVTVGERAEDVFYVADADGRPLDPTSRERLGTALRAALDPRI